MILNSYYWIIVKMETRQQRHIFWYSAPTCCCCCAGWNCWQREWHRRQGVIVHALDALVARFVLGLVNGGWVTAEGSWRTGRMAARCKFFHGMENS